MKKFNMDFETRTILCATLGSFKFSADKEVFMFKVEIERNGIYEIVEERDLKDIIVDFNDLERAATNWLLMNCQTKFC